MSLEKDYHDIYVLLNGYQECKYLSTTKDVLIQLMDIKADVVFELGLRYGEFDEYVNNNQKKNKEATEANAFAKFPDMRVLLLLKEQIQEAINNEKFLIKDSKV